MFTVCGITHLYNAPTMLPGGTGQQHCRCVIPQAVNTVSAPEDGRNYRQKYVEQSIIINKPLLLHLVGCLHYCITDARSYKHQI